MGAMGSNHRIGAGDDDPFPAMSRSRPRKYAASEHEKKEEEEEDDQEEPLRRDRAATVRSRLRSLSTGTATAHAPGEEAGELEADERLLRNLSDTEAIERNYFHELLESEEGETEPLRVAVFWKDIKDETERERITTAFQTFAADFEYGPHWAMVRVGHTYLSWGAGNVILPQRAPQLFTGARRTVTGGACAESPGFPTAVAQEGGGREIEESAADALQRKGIFCEEIVVSRARLREKIHSLSQTMLRYNTKYHYGTLSCSSQHFVRDVLQALEVDEEKVKVFKDQIANLEKVLLKRGTEVLNEEFNTHTELDNYVRLTTETMKREERMFCNAHYVLFHAWQKDSTPEAAWVCQRQTCLLRDIQKRI